MSPAKNRSRRRGFKSRRQKGPEGDVTPNAAIGEKEKRREGRERRREGGKKLPFFSLCSFSVKEFPLAVTSFRQPQQHGTYYFRFYIANSSFIHSVNIYSLFWESLWEA